LRRRPTFEDAGIETLLIDVLRRSLGRKNLPEDPPLTAAVPEGVRVYAIGDIHGRADLLDRLHALIDADFDRRSVDTVRVVYLGDYVDRGPESAAVLERLATAHCDFVKVTYLRGNHEELLLRFLNDHTVGHSWLQLGGAQTLESYGIDVSRVLGDKGYAGLSQRLKAVLPPHHLSLLERLASSFTLGDYFFCHAGVRPGTPLDRQRPEDLSWIRGPFLDSKDDFGKIVVHGHSPVDHPDFRANRINIDTRAFATGHLTCLALEGSTRRIIST